MVILEEKNAITETNMHWMSLREIEIVEESIKFNTEQQKSFNPKIKRKKKRF